MPKWYLNSSSCWKDTHTTGIKVFNMNSIPSQYMLKQDYVAIHSPDGAPLTVMWPSSANKVCLVEPNSL